MGTASSVNMSMSSRSKAALPAAAPARVVNGGAGSGSGASGGKAQEAQEHRHKHRKHHKHHHHKHHKQRRGSGGRRGSDGGDESKGANGAGVGARNGGVTTSRPVAAGLAVASRIATHDATNGGRRGGKMERTPSVASMSQASVGSYHNQQGHGCAMSGYVWLYPPSHGRPVHTSPSKRNEDAGFEEDEEPPRRVWLEARLDEGVLAWVDASGTGAPDTQGIAFASGAGAGAGAHAGAGSVGDENWYWGAARNNRLDLSQVRSVYPGRSARGAMRVSPQMNWKAGLKTSAKAAAAAAAAQPEDDAPETPYTFTVVTWGAALVLQAPNAYEFVGWLSTLRTGVASWGGGVAAHGEFHHPAARPDALSRTNSAHSVTSGGNTQTTDALFRACVENDVHTIRYVLRNEPRLTEATNVAGDTPIIAAARAGAADVVRLLLRRGVDLCAANLDGQTAVVAAAGAGHLRCVDALVRRHRKNNSRSKGGHRLSDKLEAHRVSQGAVSALLDRRGLGGLTAAHAAAAGGHVRVLELLMVEGANPFVLDDSGWTVAHYACRCSRSIRCIALLCDVAVDLVDWWDTSGNTPLHIAASSGWVEGVQLLLQTAANPHSVNIQGFKPKQLAVTGQHRECATLLDEYKDSTGLARDPEEVAKEQETSIDRIMAIWDRFFANAINNAEKMDRKRATAQYDLPPRTTPRRVATSRGSSRGRGAGAGAGSHARARSGAGSGDNYYGSQVVAVPQGVSNFDQAVAARVQSYDYSASDYNGYDATGQQAAADGGYYDEQGNWVAYSSYEWAEGYGYYDASGGYDAAAYAAQWGEYAAYDPYGYGAGAASAGAMVPASQGAWGAGGYEPPATYHAAGNRHPNQRWAGAGAGAGSTQDSSLGRAAWGFAAGAGAGAGSGAAEVPPREAGAGVGRRRDPVNGYGGDDGSGAQWATPSPGLPRAVNSAQRNAGDLEVQEMVPWTPDDPATVAAAAQDVWEEAVDDSTGVAYYYNHRTGKSVWERPVTGNYAPPPEEGGAARSLAARRARARIGGDGTTGASGAPTRTRDPRTPPRDAWEQHYTDDGVPYFYNRFLGESSWERPAPLGGGRTVSSMFGTDDDDEDGDDDGGGKQAERRPRRANGRGTAQYEQHFDGRGAGAGTSRASTPAWGDDSPVESKYGGVADAGDAGESVPPVDSTGFVGDKPRDDGAGGLWSTQVDNQGRLFEYNLVTGVSRWPESEAAASDVEGRDATTSFTNGGSTGADSNGAARGAAVDDGAAWEAFYSDDGHRYWYNAATGESVWDDDT